MSESLKKLPVTTIVRLKPKLGLIKETLDWFHAISEKAAHFKGHLGAEIFEEINDHTHPEFAIIIQFDTYENSMIWEESKERKEQIALSEILFDEVKPKIQLTGLEYWFEAKDDKSHITPEKWKMAIVTVGVIFIFSNTLIPWLRDGFNPLRWHPLVNSFLSVIIMVVLMTYLVMPFITKVLSGWLFKQKSRPV
ncbi:MAG: hypothetical protein H7Z13_03930 [Ferruginibacter sp.]|nr:hypothetical protein [Ferruginibacter sp.]